MFDVVVEKYHSVRARDQNNLLLQTCHHRYGPVVSSEVSKSVSQ